MKASAPTTIMVIGSDTHFCYLMQRYVKKSGHQVYMPLPNEDAVELAQKIHPVAIVLEVDQPNTIGWKVLRGLKGDPAVSHIPVVLCSWMEDEKLALAEGVDITMRMPILYQDFLTALTDVGIVVENVELTGGIE